MHKVSVSVFVTTLSVDFNMCSVSEREDSSLTFASCNLIRFTSTWGVTQTLRWKKVVSLTTGLSQVKPMRPICTMIIQALSYSGQLGEKGPCLSLSPSK